MNALDFARTLLNNEKCIKETDLLIIEGDTKLSETQGFINGVSQTEQLLYSAGFELLYKSLDLKSCKVVDLSEKEIYELYNSVDSIKSSRKYDEYRQHLQEAIEGKKNYLFNDAKKGRELNFVIGWKKAIFFIDKVFSDIEETYNYYKEKGSTFDF